MVAGLIEFSPEALGAFKQRLVTRPARAVRLGVRGSGCDGMTYTVQFEDDPPRAGDNEWQVDGISFVIDKKSAPLLSGSTVTFTKTLMKQGFDFENPHETSRCGCGHSFSTK
jgi:iron-sulfur cluster assembly protein